MGNTSVLLFSTAVHKYQKRLLCTVLCIRVLWESLLTRPYLRTLHANAGSSIMSTPGRRLRKSSDQRLHARDRNATNQPSASWGRGRTKKNHFRACLIQVAKEPHPAAERVIAVLRDGCVAGGGVASPKFPRSVWMVWVVQCFRGHLGKHCRAHPPPRAIVTLRLQVCRSCSVVRRRSRPGPPNPHTPETRACRGVARHH